MKSLMALMYGLAAARAVVSQGFYLDPRMEDGEYSIHVPYHDDDDDGDATSNGVKPAAAPLVRRWEPQSRTWEHVVNLTSSPPPPPLSSLRRFGKRFGTGEMTFVFNEETKAVENLALDTFHTGELPLLRAELNCDHSVHYPTMFEDLDADDYRASRRSFFNWCELYTFRGGHVEVSLKGSVAVYTCARLHVYETPQRCSEGEYIEAERLMNRTCGRLKPGRVSMDPWAKEYGRAFKGTAICNTYETHALVPGADEDSFGDKETWGHATHIGREKKEEMEEQLEKEQWQQKLKAVKQEKQRKMKAKALNEDYAKSTTDYVGGVQDWLPDGR